MTVLPQVDSPMAAAGSRRMRTQSQLSESIQRFQAHFWNKQQADRPPVGIYDERIYMPINFLRRPFSHSTVHPDDINENLVMTEYEYSLCNHSVSCDDFISFSAPWRGIPWLEASCACPVRFSEGSLAPDHFVQAPEEFAAIPIPAPNDWFDCMRRETARLHAQQPADCWISPSILRGPSDVLSAMRGLKEFYLDLHDNPQALADAAARVNALLIKVLDMHYSIVQPKLGGFGHIFGYWAPEKTIVIQEDVLGMCSPNVYRDIFMRNNAELIRRMGAHVMFHLHSTGYQHYKHILNIPGIAGIEMVLESIGPTAVDLVPVFREILEKSRLMLHIGTGFEHLPEALRKLPKEGLYVAIADKYIRNDQEFRDFIGAIWS
jgi:hypothetical protein